MASRAQNRSIKRVASIAKTGDTHTAVNNLYRDFLSGANLVTGIELNGIEPTRVVHGLGYRYTGYIIVRCDAACRVYEDPDPGADDSRELWLNSADPVTLAILVF